MFIIPWLRARFSSDCLASLANLLLALVYVFMAFVRQTELPLCFGRRFCSSEVWFWCAGFRSMLSNQRNRPDSTHIRIGRRLNGLEKNDEHHTSRKWNNGRSAYFHRACLWFCHGPLPRLPGARESRHGIAHVQIFVLASPVPTVEIGRFDGRRVCT